MTEEEWVRATDADLRQLMWGLDARRQRLLAVAACRAMGRWVDYPVLHDAFGSVETFADTCRTKAALRRARQAARALRAELFPNDRGFQLALFAVQVAASENAMFGTLEDACRALVAAEGLSVAGARRQLYPSVRDIVGDPSRSVAFSPDWRTSTAVSLARGMYESRDFGAMPILGDALQDAGCDAEPLLSHCRAAGAVHVRGCWAVDLVLGKT